MLWSPDRLTAERLLEGEEQGPISLDEAAALAEQIGVDMPPPCSPAELKELSSVVELSERSTKVRPCPDPAMP